MGARGFVHGVIDMEVRYLTGNACAWVGVLRFNHTPAPAVVLPFEEDVSVDQGGALGLHGFEGRKVRWFWSNAKPGGERRGEKIGASGTYPSDSSEEEARRSGWGIWSRYSGNSRAKVAQ
jgi:hypothetical protein